MHIGLLGELEVLDDSGRDVPISGSKLRALLAILALSAGRVVSTDHLIELLWGEEPPATVRNSLQGLVSKLRRTLGSAHLVAMRGSGYALDLPPSSVDVHRYEELVAGGRAAAPSGDPGKAAELLAQADALWRGDALADFAYEDLAAGHVTRLSELRLAVLEERLELELQLGRHSAVLVQLEALVYEHPLRERIRGLLMVALYRSGRQADALQVFQDGRRLLNDELGLDPGPELRRLESAVLSQDPSLDGAPVPSVQAQPVPAGRAAIPQTLTPLVGRSDEVAELSRLLAEHRLLTLVGPGGVGKTRLGLEAARAVAADLEYGGCLVELAPVGDGSGVREAMASALGVPDASRLAEVIGEREMLLVLDNCEHVITTAAEVAEDLLRRCPALRLLATSREGLRVGGEMVWPVPPLPAADAVTLFTIRARAAGAQLERSEELDQVVADICQRLDGLPLAIELAAARTRAFPVQQIASRLGDRFRLLTGGSRTALPRQQTLRAVVDWSYDLLFEHEQRIFERLSVFPGGCDLTTLEIVASDETLAADEVADLVNALVDKSLVLATPHDGNMRFTQLQTLAQYGREKLTERREAPQIRNAMAAHYAALCARSAEAYTGPDQRDWLRTIDREHDNLRAALDWAMSNGDAETALTIAGGASWPHWLRGAVGEGKRWIDEAFDCVGEVTDGTRALALTGRGLLDFLAGDTGNADADLEAALAIFEARGDIAGMSLAQSFYAEQPTVTGDMQEARRRRQDILAFYDTIPDDPFVQISRAYTTGRLALLGGDLGRAEPHYRTAAAGYTLLDRPVMAGVCLGIVADFDERAGDVPAAIRALEEAVEMNDSLGLRGFTGAQVARLGWLLLQVGEVERAEALYERAFELSRWLRNAPVVLLALTGSAVLHRLNGRSEEAAAAAQEALLIYSGAPRGFRNRIDPESEIRTAASVCHGVLGAIAAEVGDFVRAAQLLGRSEELRRQAGVPVPPSQEEDLRRARDAAMAALGQSAFDDAFEAGRNGESGREATVTG